ncbi:ABC transporter permease [Clostridium boliviensis]|uniref:ABC transporter permease n=1 Tax=Clostridium boliviensis TaxID=318465 RepID=A0ABU4GLU9_9CLOT|nr:ABC transporter permease [Clostridium boliviensis]MDW2797923.1 ABC transporter permease [Clostridium boliviensis]
MGKNSLIKRITGSREASLLLVLIGLCIIIQILSPSFLTAKSLQDMVKNNAVIMIMALGMLCVLLIGGIDISITSTLAVSGMAVGMLLKYNVIHNIFLLFLIAILIGALCGAAIGLVVSRGKVLPIIATMGFMYIYRGFAYLIAKSQWASAENLGDFKNFALEKELGLGLLNNVIFIVLLCYIIFFAVMKWSRTGRKIYAVGSNPEAAAISGINTMKIKLIVYTVMGMLSGLCGALSVAVYSSAQPNMLYGKEMDVIAACVIGGVSMSGGRGTVAGALLGSLILAVIAKALPLVGIDSIVQNTVKGVIILAVIILNVVAQRMMQKKNLKRREM